MKGEGRMVKGEGRWVNGERERGGTWEASTYTEHRKDSVQGMTSARAQVAPHKLLSAASMERHGSMNRQGIICKRPSLPRSLVTKHPMRSSHCGEQRAANQELLLLEARLLSQVSIPQLRHRHHRTNSSNSLGGEGQQSC